MRIISPAPGLQQRLTTLSRRLFIGALLLAGAGTVLGKDNAPRAYKTGYSSILKLGRDLRAALPPEQREKIADQPISMETDNRPFVRLLNLKDDGEQVLGVWVSAGFIDLINHVAHAQAIDRIEKGYLQRYVEMLEGGGVPPLPKSEAERYWTDAVLNEQQSNFNSIVGVVVGMKLANHYLWQNEGTKENELSAEEWRKAFLHGVRNALRAGCMMEGAVPFIEAIDEMEERPPWAREIVHPKVKIASVRPAMEAAQKEFLAGE